MSAAIPSNAITQRLDLIKSYYQEFIDAPPSLLCLWLIEEDDWQMLESFVQIENTEHAAFNDLFLEFKTPFYTAEQYNQDILDELRAYINDGKSDLESEGIQCDIKLPEVATSINPFLKGLSELFTSFNQPEGRIVAWIRPQLINKIKPFEKWLSETLQYEFPSNVRLMMATLKSQHQFEMLTESSPQLVIAVEPELDMPAAMRELASAGDPEDPGVKFRLHYLDMGQAAAKQNLPKVREHGTKALNIAQQQEEWEHLEIAIYIAMANALMHDKSCFDEALELLDKAIATSNSLYNAKNPIGSIMLIQSLFAKGSALIAAGSNIFAAEQFEQAIPVAASDEKSTFQLLEAQRLAAFCHEQNRDNDSAWKFYFDALLSAEKLDPQIRANSTLPYVGKSLLRLAPKVKQQHEEAFVIDKMVAYVGEDWEEKIQSKNRT